MMKLMLKIFYLFYGFFIEPIAITVIIILGFIPFGIQKIKNNIQQTLGSDTLLICFILSLVNRMLFKFFIKKLGFELLLMVLITSIIATLFKMTGRVSQGKPCDIHILLNTFAKLFGWALIFTMVFIIIL